MVFPLPVFCICSSSTNLGRYIPTVPFSFWHGMSAPHSGSPRHGAGSLAVCHVGFTPVWGIQGLLSTRMCRFWGLWPQVLLRILPSIQYSSIWCEVAVAGASDNLVHSCCTGGRLLHIVRNPFQAPECPAPSPLLNRLLYCSCLVLIFPPRLPPLSSSITCPKEAYNPQPYTYPNIPNLHQSSSFSFARWVL